MTNGVGTEAWDIGSEDIVSGGKDEDVVHKGHTSVVFGLLEGGYRAWTEGLGIGFELFHRRIFVCCCFFVVPAADTHHTTCACNSR